MGDDDPFMQRAPREIDINSEREILECERLLRTFETLSSLSRRKLKKLYNDIEVTNADVRLKCQELDKV